MAIVINGSGTVTGISVGGLPDGVVDAGTLATDSVDSAELIDGAIDAAHLASGVGGKVLQVVQVTTNSSTSPSTSFADVTGADITITPSATSSKVLVIWNAGGMAAGDNLDIQFKILRDSTIVRQTTRYAYSQMGANSFWHPTPIAIQYLDSPSTTSAINYSLQFATGADADFRINHTAITNGLIGIAMEIGA